MAWGNRKMITNKLNDLMDRMGNSPYDFVMNYSEDEFEKIEDFKHRTMNSVDIDFMLRSLQNIYKNHNGLEASFSFDPKDEDSFNALESFRSEEHTSELQSRGHLVCRLLLEKKKITY